MRSGQPSADNSMDSIDRRVLQNESELLTMEQFLEAKQKEVRQLQQYLLQEFESMEGWKSRKDRVTDLLSTECSTIFRDVRQLMQDIVQEYRGIFSRLIDQALGVCKKKIAEKERQILDKNNTIAVQLGTIEKLKYELNKRDRLASISPHNLRRFPETAQQSHIRMPANQQKSLSRSTIIDSQRATSKSRDKFEQHPLNQTNKISSSYKFGNNVEDRQLNKSTTTKRIMFEVQKVLKQDYENQRAGVDHKKYVKEKIEYLKSKNSAVGSDTKPANIRRI